MSSSRKFSSDTAKSDTYSVDEFEDELEEIQHNEIMENKGNNREAVDENFNEDSISSKSNSLEKINSPENAATTNYVLCPSSDLINYSESELDSIYAEAVAKFNLKPKAVREFLCSRKVIKGLPSEIAKFIFQQPKLSKRRIGEYIGNFDPYNQLVCESLFGLYNFAGASLDSALRVLMREFRLPGEAQQIDRILEKFAIAYHTQNPGVFLSSDTAYVLSFSLIMLNTDLHNHSITPDKKMTLDQFVRNNRGINQGQDLPHALLEHLYYSVRDDEIRMDEADMYESEVVAFMAPTKSGWLSKKSDAVAVLSHWKRHWFVLNDGCLYYFNMPSDEGPRCIIPLDNTRILKGAGTCELIITSASGDVVKSSKVLEDGRMEQGRHAQFTLKSISEEDRDSWLKLLQGESLRFRPLHDVFLRIREQDKLQAQVERPLLLPHPLASGWARKRVGGAHQSWKRRFFSLYPDFDGGGATLLYYVNQQVAQKMLDQGMQTQQGYLRMSDVSRVELSEDQRRPMILLQVEDKLWSLVPEEVEIIQFWFTVLLKSSSSSLASSTVSTKQAVQLVA